jgi:hypothetical protein
VTVECYVALNTCGIPCRNMCVPGMADNSDGESPSTSLIEVKVSETQGCLSRDRI